ncbi:MAG TPA: LPS export ABC transporter periplasmic protein LptC [Candidatus Eremiobacteraceae bacterium]|nr:LPS export ABC transporter periplasmic protein LptC [Candidatus Eremiobacteraceae bacterium]
MTYPLSFGRRAELVLPFAFFTLGPVLPMLVLLADVVPRGLAVGGRVYAVALVIAMLIASAITFVAIVLRRGWLALVEPPLALPLLAVIATAALAGAIGVSPASSAFELVCEVGNFIAFVAIVWNMWDDRIRRTLLACYFTVGIAATVFGVALTLTRHPPEMFAYQHGRAAGTFLQPNEFGGYLLFFIALGIAQAGAPLLLRRLGAAAAIVGTIALALSVSRAAWLGLIIGLPILIWRFGRAARVAYVSAALVALVLGTTSFRDVAHDPSENPSRIAVWQGAVRMAERFALTGVGPLGFSKVYPTLKQPDAAVDEVHAHDLPLNVLVENGVLGFAAFVWLIVAGIAQARRTIRQIPPDDRERTLLFYGLAAAFIASAFQNVLDVVSTFVFLLWWPMMGLMFALGRPSVEVAPDRVARASLERTPELRSGATIAVTALGLVALLAGCGSKSPPAAIQTPNPSTSAPAQPPYYIIARAEPGRPVELKEIHNGLLEYLLRADEVQYQTADSKGTLRNVLLSFYKGRTLRMRVTAPIAEVRPNDRNVALSGGVRAGAANGASMSADSMEYDGNRHVLTAAGHVKANDNRGNSIDGDRAEADLDLRRVRVWGPNGEQTMTFGK